MPRGFATFVAAAAVVGLVTGIVVLGSGPETFTIEGFAPVEPWAAKPGPSEGVGSGPAEVAGKGKVLRTVTREESWDFLTYGPGALWALAVVVILVVCAGAIGYAVWCSRAGWNPLAGRVDLPTRLDRWGVLWWACLLVLYFAAPATAQLNSDEALVARHAPVAWYKYKLGFMFAVGLAAVTALLYRLWWVDRLAHAVQDRGAAPADLDAARALAAELRWCLLGVGAMVSLAALSTAAVRVGLNGYHGREVMSLGVVVTFGLYYTLVLGVIVVPVQVRVVALARAVAAATYPVPAGGPPNEALAQQEAALNFIGIGGDWTQAFRSGVVVLSPLFAALVTQLLPSK